MNTNSKKMLYSCVIIMNRARYSSTALVCVRCGFHGHLEADLEAISPSHAATHGGHFGFAEGERAF